METKGQSRKNKTRQDLQPASQRERVQEWDRRRQWAMTHKPVRSGDWLGYQTRNPR